MKEIKSYNKKFKLINPNIKSMVQRKAPKTTIVRELNIDKQKII